MILLLIIIPTIYIIIGLSEEVINVFNFFKSLDFLSMRDSFSTFTKNNLPIVISDQIDFNHFDIQKVQEIILRYSQNVSLFLITNVNFWVQNILNIIFNFLISLIVIYAVLSKGKVIKRFFVKLLPLSFENSQTLVNKVTEINNLNILVNGIGGIIQGSLGGLIFMFAGSESVILFTVTMTLLAFIPVVGISLVYLPYCIYLIVMNQSFDAIVVGLSCFMVAFFVENIYKPKFIGERIEINSLLLLMSMLGGAGLFGIPGIFYGPIIIAIFLFWVDIFHLTFINYDEKTKVFDTLPSEETEND